MKSKNLKMIDHTSIHGYGSGRGSGGPSAFFLDLGGKIKFDKFGNMPNINTIFKIIIK